MARAPAGQQEIPHGSRRAVLVVGIASLLAGIFTLAMSLGWFAVAPSRMHAPTWMVGLAGAFFDLAGLAILVPARFVRTRGVLSALAVTLLAVLFDWIAFGPGETRAHATRGISALLAPTPSGENAARAAFALFAVLISLIALWSWSRLLGELREGAGRSRGRRRHAGR